MSSVVKYTLARLLLFAVAWGLLYLMGARGLLGPALAVLISGLVSFVLLTRQRDEMSSRLVSGLAEVRRRVDDGAAAEDLSAGESVDESAAPSTDKGKDKDKGQSEPPADEAPNAGHPADEAPNAGHPADEAPNANRSGSANHSESANRHGNANRPR